MSTKERLKVLLEAKPDSWIAFSADESRVVASGNSYAEAVQMASEKGEDNPVIAKTPESWIPRVFSPAL